MLWILTFLFLILILLEIDRNYIIPHNFYSYYIQFFPKQLLFGIHNAIQRLIAKQYIYNTDKLKLTSFLQKNRETILKDFYKYRNETEIMAHNTTNMLTEDKNCQIHIF